ncbi:fibroleukin-like [Drosophila innubila]|uniref:fibroleukin-like n=1 Tax=Drosophila innubila TaxID=198719 RepID=UPI00148E6E5B|nr:fibroleukin-like [Drosophila innubila]
MSKSECKDTETMVLRAKLDPLQELVDSYKNQIQDLKAHVEDLRESLRFCKGRTTTKDSDSTTSNDLKNQKSNTRIQSKLYDLDLKDTDKAIAGTSFSRSCLDFEESSDIHQISVPGIVPFNVLCDATIAGPGWTVIQQRVNGKVHFYRDWASYRKGFGSFDGDFFLGLEKIHRLTSNSRHDLYIHMEKFDGSTMYGHYDNFKIAGEEDHYRLISLGKCSGTSRYDALRSHEHKKFTTFDNDNDEWPEGNCAIFSGSGWWHDHCVNTNLNGKYFNSEVQNEQSIFWENKTSLKKVKMMIRPRGN